MSVDSKFLTGPPAANISGERSLFDPAMNSRLLEGFQGSGLGMG
jgi:hypothetical protein